MSKSSKQLLEELRQKQPFGSREEEAVVALFRTADYVRRETANVLEPYDVTPQQYNVMRILRGAGDEGLPILEVANRMVERSPGVTRLIDRLEKKELLCRERSTEDRRQVKVTITDKGLDLLKLMDKSVIESNQKMMSGLSEKELEQLIALLDAVRS